MKRLLLKRTISKLKVRKKKYLEKIVKYRKINGILDSFCAVNTTISTTCLILSFSFVGTPLLVISIATSASASIIIAFKKSINLDRKLDAHKTSYLSITDLIRKLELELTGEHSAKEYNEILESCFEQLSLINGNAIPLSVSESD